MKTLFRILAFTLFWVPVLVSSAQISVPQQAMIPPDSTFAPVRAHIQARVTSGELPSVAVAVAHNGRIIWEEAFGWADRAAKIAATPHTMYAIGSLSKSITATGLMRLVEQGKVNLEDPVGMHLDAPGLHIYEGLATDVTVHRLLQMTAGIPHAFLYDAVSVPADFTARTAVVVFPPGKVFEYSNSSYGLLGRVIEHASGRSLQDFMREEVFLPLGMTQTTTAYRAPAAVLYKSDQSIHAPYAFGPVSAGGYYSSAHDLIRYALFHLEEGDVPAILRAETLRRMHTDKSDLPGASMALGWGSITLDDGLVWLLSNGSVEGGNSNLTLIPSERLAVVCLVNQTSNASIADQVAMEITEALVPGFADRVNRLMQKYAGSFSRPYTPQADLTGRWAGKIEMADTTVPISLVFTREGSLVVQVQGEEPVQVENLAWEGEILRGRFETKRSLPGIRGELPRRIDAILRLDQGALEGYLSILYTGEQGRYSLPAYVRFQRTGDQ